MHWKIMSINYRLSMIASLLSSVALATPIVNETTSYYAVSGSTPNQLRQEMNKKGPLSDGRHFDAYTKWSVTWNYTYLEKNNQCEMTTINVYTKVAYTLPKWTDYDQADHDQQEKWDTYLTHLLAHEQGHADNGKSAAIAIDEALHSLPTMESCLALSANANHRAEDIITEYNSKDATYDAATNHGIRQGAFFP